MGPRTERLIQGVFVCCSTLAGITGMLAAAFGPGHPVFDRILLGMVSVICLFTAVHAATRKRPGG